MDRDLVVNMIVRAKVLMAQREAEQGAKLRAAKPHIYWPDESGFFAGQLSYLVGLLYRELKITQEEEAEERAKYANP